MIVVVALAGAAWCVDRFVLGGATDPASAAAAENPSPAARPASADATMRTVSVAERLEGVAGEAGEVADAFQTPAWLAPRVQPAAAASGQAPRAGTPQIALSSVIMGRTPVAVINGRNMTVGQAASAGDGTEAAFTVDVIEPHSVVISLNGRQVRVFVPGHEPQPQR